MQFGRRRTRKRPYKSPRDRTAEAANLRIVGELLKRRKPAKGLSWANHVLATPGLHKHKQSRVLALVGDSEFKRGAFDEAARIYQRVATLCVDHHELWVRPLLGKVAALLKACCFDQALMIARHTCDLARHKRAEFDEKVRVANHELVSRGQVTVPPSPPRVSVVATRLGYLFLQSGEPASAREFFEQALNASSGGACRARQGLARIALAENDFGGALKLSADAIRRRRYAAKTLPAWSVHIAARRKLGGWKISERLLKGLETAPASVRARAVLEIVRELRKSDMRQWREVAGDWSGREGKNFPIIEAEIRKLVLSSAKFVPGDVEAQRCAAEQLLKTPQLSRNEWLAGAKELVRTSLWQKKSPDIRNLVRYADKQYGGDSGPRTAHGLALSCMMAKRHDLARPLLQRNIEQLPVGRGLWAKSVWSLARMESVLENHAESAALYKQLVDMESVPLRFRLQAQLLWARALVAAGQTSPLLGARPSIDAALTSVEDPELLMDFARQLLAAAPELHSWSMELFERGESLALGQFAAAGHPSLAAGILFKLTRRQVYDFDRSGDAIRFWERMADEKKEWLWSEHSSFWAYLEWVFEAYQRAGSSQQTEDFALYWLRDSATPPEGRVRIGVPYAEWLVRRHRVAEATEIFDALIKESPTHALCARAWYWAALRAYRQGDEGEARRCALAIRQAQGTDVNLYTEWTLDARALLLLAGLEIGNVDAHAVKYSAADYASAKKLLLEDMGRLP